MKILIFFLSATILEVKCQKNAFEVSISSVIDDNFNLALGTPNNFLPTPLVDNRYATAFSFLYERRGEKKISFITGAKSVNRKINYLYLNTVVQSFNLSTVEMFVGLRFLKIDNNNTLRFDISPGINQIITKDEATLYLQSTSNNTFRFVKNINLCYFTQACLSVESKFAKNNSIIFFCAYQHQFTPLFRFMSLNNNFGNYSPYVKPHFISIGIAFRYSHQQKKVKN